MRALIAFSAVVFASAAHASTLTAADIREEVIGRRIFLGAPAGGEFPLNYRPDGTVDGDGEALGLGRFVAPRDRGRWWLRGDRLCQRFTVWYDGATMCFELSRTGPSRLRWVRDNGESGSARIGPPVR